MARWAGPPASTAGRPVGLTLLRLRLAAAAGFCLTRTLPQVTVAAQSPGARPPVFSLRTRPDSRCLFEINLRHGQLAK